MAGTSNAKHRHIYEHIRAAIASGEYPVGHRVPSEAEFGVRFDACRHTVSRALRELERQGLLVRRRGAGTFVCRPNSVERNLFGLIIPIGQSVKSIFGRVCGQMARVAQANGFALVWGDPLDAEAAVQIDRANRLADQYVARKVAGVFLAPIEAPADRLSANRQIVDRLRNAGISVVLVDHRDICGYPPTVPT